MATVNHLNHWLTQEQHRAHLSLAAEKMLALAQPTTNCRGGSGMAFQQYVDKDYDGICLSNHVPVLSFLIPAQLGDFGRLTLTLLFSFPANRP